MHDLPVSEITDIAVVGDHRQLIEYWLETYLPERIASGELALNTLSPYRRAIRSWLEHIGVTPRPTPTMVSGWVAKQRLAGLGANTISTYLAAVKSLYRWAESQDAYPNIARSVRGPVVRRDTPLPCPPAEEIADLFRSLPARNAREARNRALLAVLYSTALRTISVCRAKVEDLDLQAGTLRHQPKGHRDKDAVAVLSPTAVEALRDYMAHRLVVLPYDALFTSERNYTRGAAKGLTSRAIRGILLEMWEVRGMVRRDAAGHVTNPGHYSAHALRRAAVTVIAERFGLDHARTLAGHASVDTTRRAYARVNSYKQLQQASQALDFPPIGGNL